MFCTAVLEHVITLYWSKLLQQSKVGQHSCDKQCSRVSPGGLARLALPATMSMADRVTATPVPHIPVVVLMPGSARAAIAVSRLAGRSCDEDT